MAKVVLAIKSRMKNFYMPILWVICRSNMLTKVIKSMWIVCRQKLENKSNKPVIQLICNWYFVIIEFNMVLDRE